MSSPLAAPSASQWRSLLFIPQFAFPKVARLDADCFIVDLQDAVPLQAKAGARRGLVEAYRSGVFAGRNVVVRINELALPHELEADLDVCVGLPGLLGVMPTMAEKPEDLDRVHEMIAERERARGVPEGSMRFLPLVETPGAVLNAYAVARAGGRRNLGLLLGTGDLLRLSAASSVSEMTLDFPRNTVVYAARAAGIEPFDTPHVMVNDRIGLERDSRAAKIHGFTGKACVHPSQLDVVNRELMPSPAEAAWSRSILDAQRSGGLGRLVARAPGMQEGEEEHGPRSTDAMAIVDGRLIGPPHMKTAKRVMSRLSRFERAPAVGGVVGRVVSHQIEARVAPGVELPNPYELTISAGWRELWMQCFYSHDRPVTSAPFAARLGLGEAGAPPLPFLMSLYLACCMSSTHGAIYHLGFRDARQLAPCRVGDTFRQRIRLKEVRNTGDGDRAVVRTRRELVRDDSVVVFSLDKLELYRRQAEDIAPTAALTESELSDARAAALFRGGILGRAAEARAAAIGVVPACGTVTPLAAGELLLHSFARPLGVSANLALSTLFLVTHPIHLDHGRFDQGDGQGVVVSGGLVVALTVAASARDLHEVLCEELISADNIRPVAPTDTVGALTYVLERRELEEIAGFEELTLRTLGVKGITPSEHLAFAPVPRALLAERIPRPSDYDRICHEAGATWLEGRIVTQVTRRVIRALPSR